jgi:hypothetical protein
MHSCFKVTHSILLNVLYLALPSLLLQMVRTRQTARKSTRGPPHPILHSQEVSDPEDHSNGGWVDTDTEEEPMELPEDHPEVSSGSNEGPTGGDGGDSGAADGDQDKGGDDDPDAPGDATTIQMMIQSQLSPQTHHHLSLAMRNRYFTWTLRRDHSPRFSGGLCRGLVFRGSRIMRLTYSGMPSRRKSGLCQC